MSDQGWETEFYSPVTLTLVNVRTEGKGNWELFYYYLGEHLDSDLDKRVAS